MRKGRVHKIFGLSHKHGLSNCLSSIAKDGSLVNINDFIKTTEIPNLHIMTSGDVPPNPSELLSSPNMRRFLTALNSQYDVVICDGTPCVLVSDSVILSKIVDTTVVVTAYETTKLDNLIKVKKAIEIVGGNIGGVVINKMAINSKSYHNKYYYGNYNRPNTSVSLNTNASDSILDNILRIDETIQYMPTSIDIDNNHHQDISLNSENLNFNELARMINYNLKEISELKLLYKNMMISTLEDSHKNSITNSNIVTELLNIKHSYEDSISNLNENILNELSNIKNTYIDLLAKETEEMTYLNKLSNIKMEDNTNEILDEINEMKNSYSSHMKSQNEQINSLNDAIYDIQVNNDGFLLNNLSKIYKQLQNISSKFNLLDRKANTDETLNKNINKPNTIKHNFDVKKLNDKVIKIQDYLEDKYNSVITETNDLNFNEESNDSDKQIDIIENLLDNPEHQDASIEQKALVVSKSKRKKSMTKTNHIKQEDDEEPIEIVSQILCANNNKTHVG